MSFNGFGDFTRLYNWVTDKNASVRIRADKMDAEMDGFATGLSTCITKDGQTTITANIPFNAKRLTGLGDATADTDGLNRQSADARYTRNADDLTAETTLADADLVPFHDTSAGNNASITWANLKTAITGFLGALAAKNTVATADIDNAAVGTDKLADNSVTLTKLEDGTSGDILYYGVSGAPARLGTGAQGQVLKQGSNYPEWGSVPINDGELIVAYITSGTTHGAATTAGSKVLYPLSNVKKNTIVGAVMASSIITLPAGTYKCEGFAYFRHVGSCVVFLRNEDTSSDILLGSHGYQYGTDQHGESAIDDEFTLGAETDVAIRYECQYAYSSGLGYGGGVSGDNLLGQFTFTKVV